MEHDRAKQVVIEIQVVAEAVAGSEMIRIVVGILSPKIMKIY